MGVNDWRGRIGIAPVISGLYPTTPAAGPAVLPQQNISDYNDPLAVNSLADVVLTTFDPNMHRVDLGGIESTPGLNIISGVLVDLLWDKTLRPIAEGDWGAAGLNTLTNVFETLDVLANPVRAVVQGEPIGRAMGWTGEGRYNYDYDIDTGLGDIPDFIANLGAEILSDPLNWISFGTKALAKKAVQDTVEEATARTVGDIARAYGDDVADALRTASDISADAKGPFRAAFQDWLDGKSTRTMLGKYASAQTGPFSEYFTERITKTLLDPEVTRQLVVASGGQAEPILDKFMQTLRNYVDIDMADTVINGVRQANIVSENIQRGLFSASIRTTPVGWLGARAAMLNSDILRRVTNSAEDQIFKELPSDINPLAVNKHTDLYKQFVRQNKDALMRSRIPQNVAEDVVRTAVEQRAILKQMQQLEELARVLPDPLQFKAQAESIVLAGTPYTTLGDYLIKLRSSGSPYLQEHVHTLEDMFRIPVAQRVAAVPEQIIRRSFNLGDLDKLRVSNVFTPAYSYNAQLNALQEKLLDGLRTAQSLAHAQNNTDVVNMFSAAINSLKNANVPQEVRLQRVESALAALPPAPVTDYVRTALDEYSAQLTRAADAEHLLYGFASNKAYAMQLRKQERNEMLYNASAPLVDTVISNPQIGNEIMQAYPEMQDIVKRVTQYSAVSEAVRRSDLDDTVKSALMDTIHTFDDYTGRSLTRYTDTIVRSINRQLNALGQDSIDALPVVARKYADKLDSPQNVTDLLRQLSDNVLHNDITGRIPVVLRMETSSDLPGSAEAIRFIYRIGDGQEVSLVLTQSAMPTQSAIRRLLDLPGDMPSADVIEAWRKWSAQQTYTLPHDALTRFAKDLYEAGGAQKEVRVLTYGGDEVEATILRRMLNTDTVNFEHKSRLYGLLSRDENSEYKYWVDLQKQIRSQRSVYVITPQDKATVQELLRPFIESGAGPIIPRLDEGTIDNLIIAASKLDVLNQTQAAEVLRETAERVSLARHKIIVLESGLMRDYGLITGDTSIMRQALGAYNISQVTMRNMPSINARVSYDIHKMLDYMNLDIALVDGLSPQRADELYYLVRRVDKVATQVQAPNLITPKIQQQLLGFITDNMDDIRALESNYVYFNPTTPTQVYAMAYDMSETLGRPFAFANNVTSDITSDVFRATSGAILPVPSATYWNSMETIERYKLWRKYTTQQQQTLSQFMDSQNMYSLRSRTSFVMQSDLLPRMSRVYTLLDSVIARTDMRSRFDLYTDFSMLYKLRTLEQFNERELLEYVYGAARGQLVISFTDIAMPPGARTRFTDWANALLNKTPDGLIVQRVDNTLYIGLDPTRKELLQTLSKDYRLEREFDLRAVGTQVPEMQDVTEALHDLYRTLDRYSDGRIRFSAGGPYTATAAKRLYDLLPESFAQKIISPDELISDTWDLFRNTGYNHSFIGDLETQRAFGLPAQNFLTAYLESANNMLLFADRATRMGVMFFSDGSVYRTSNMFHGIARDKVYRILEENRDNYGVYKMIQDSHSKTGMRIAETGIKHAYDSGAIVMPKIMAKDIMQVWNKFEFTNPAMRIFDKLILSPLKSGYLMTLGWVFRNYISANFSNITTVAGMDEWGSITKSTLAAATVLRKYMTWMQEVMTYTKGEYANADAINEVLRKLTPDDQLLFRRVHTFMNSASAGGQLDIVYNLAKQTKKAGADWIDDASAAIGTVLWENPVTSFFIKGPNDFIERTRRLGLYLHEVQYGKSSDEALSAVLRTHFNYDNTSYERLILETVLPFSGFMFNSLMFWSRQLSKHGWVAAFLGDAVNVLSDDSDYDNYELNENRSLQYNILAGNLMLDDNMTIKLGLPVMDSLALLSNPYETLEGKLNAPLRLSLEAIHDSINNKPWTPERIGHELLTNAPIIGGLVQKFYNNDAVEYVGSARKAFERTNNYATLAVPSVFGGVQRQHYFTYDNGKKVYMTLDTAKYMRFVQDGAIPVVSKAQVEQLRKEYKPNISARKKYYRAYTKKASVPKAHNASHGGTRQYKPRNFSYKSSMREYWKVKSNRRGTIVRNVERTAKMVGPRLYRDLYTDKGVSRMRTRMMPFTSQYLQMRLRQEWSKLR